MYSRSMQTYMPWLNIQCLHVCTFHTVLSRAVLVFLPRRCGNSSPLARSFAPYPCLLQELCSSENAWDSRAPTQRRVPRSERCAAAQVYALPLLISKSLLHSEGNHLLAPREANQIKQSGKEDSLFINLTRSPGDLHYTRDSPPALAGCFADADCAPSLHHPGRYLSALHAWEKRQQRGYRSSQSTVFQ